MDLPDELKELREMTEHKDCTEVIGLLEDIDRELTTAMRRGTTPFEVSMAAGLARAAVAKLRAALRSPENLR